VVEEAAHLVSARKQQETEFREKTHPSNACPQVTYFL
jgi:hypothetical protein